VWTISHHEEHEGKTICSRQDAKSAKFGITFFFAAFAYLPCRHSQAALREILRVSVAAQAR
jgi:hypothetical protein